MTRKVAQQYIMQTVAGLLIAALSQIYSDGTEQEWEQKYIKMYRFFEERNVNLLKIVKKKKNKYSQRNYSCLKNFNITKEYSLCNGRLETLLDRKIPFIEGSGDKHINY